MVNTPTVTIGIPLFNQAEYISDTIQSALDQTYKCSIIVVNDGSTDKSVEIASQFPVRIINQVNKGLSAARNTVIMNAGTDYILFLDADDILLSECVERLVQTAQETNADITAASFRCFGVQNGDVILIPNPTLENFKEGNRIGYSALIKRPALLEVGGYSPRMTWGYEDYHLWFNFLTLGKSIVTLPEVLWLYRMKTHSMIHDAQAHHKELMEQINKDFHIYG